MIKSLLQNSAQEALRAIETLQGATCQNFLEKAAFLLSDTFRAGNKVLIAGNGGSLSDATHFAEELTGFFRKKRPALPAIALAEAAHITCVGNDVGFEQIFSRGIEALGKSGDLFIGLTTSGNSENLVSAFETARKQNLKTIAFLGKTGGKLKGYADLEWIVEGFSYSDRIQEAHMAAIHILIEATETLLFPRVAEGSQASHSFTNFAS